MVSGVCVAAADVEGRRDGEWSVCCGWWQTDEDGEIYMSVMKLRDETDELQMELERRERSGDMRGIEACKQQLNRKQQLLLEKNKIRSHYYFPCCHYFRESKNCHRFAADTVV